VCVSRYAVCLCFIHTGCMHAKYAYIHTLSGVFFFKKKFSDSAHPVFGKVTSGMDVVKAIEMER
jgi:cyclophilin family peptidyl-prolyl cis-trans isomerase